MPTVGVIRFGSFEVDTHAGELRRGGLKLKLSGQPFDVLVALLEKPGKVVSREELHDKLWSQDTFVDFEQGLNKAINKVREALGDDADNPRFIETLPRRGYRFLAPVVATGQQEIAAETGVPAEPEAAVVRSSSDEEGRYKRAGRWSLAVLVLLAVAVVLSLRAPRAPHVLRYTQLTNDGQKKSGVFSTAITTDGSRVYFGELNAQQRGTVVQVSVNGGPVSTLTTLEEPNLLTLDYSPVRSELLVSHEIATQLWALSVPGGSALRRIGNFLVDGAAWSPDGQSIVYSKVNALYIAKADGTDSRKLVTVTGDPEYPTWSPDGKLIRFTLNPWEVQSRSIWQVSADGSNLHPLFADWQSRNDGMGSWTPDGRYFIFMSFLPNGYDGAIMAVREKMALFKRSPTKGVPLTTGPLNFSGAIPSRDGRKIFAGGFLDRGELMRYDSEQHSWKTYLSGISAVDVDFSRDREWVTYVLVPDGTLWRSRVDGSQRLQLTSPSFRTSMPRWSPDRKQIAFAGLKPNGKWTLYLVSADGAGIQQLIDDNGSYQDPNWSPDGNQLVFGEITWTPKAIHILDLQSGRMSDLPDSGKLFSPRWSPDGRYIVALTIQLPPWQNTDLNNPLPQNLMRFDVETRKWTQWCQASAISYPAFSQNGKYVYFSGEEPRIYRIKVGDSKMELVTSIDVPGGMKQDDFWYWTGLAPDDAPLFLRNASTEEIYSLDVDFP
jgi:Tol biopolymer transport system component/DNA-binding winged helix-turn-helix (wHTH) protein